MPQLMKELRHLFRRSLDRLHIIIGLCCVKSATEPLQNRDDQIGQILFSQFVVAQEVNVYYNLDIVFREVCYEKSCWHCAVCAII